MKVLIVEDDPATRTGLEKLIRGLGFDVESAGTLSDAHRLLSEGKPDLCLTDMVLPDGDGLDLIRAARVDNPSREVIALTGHGSVKVAVEAMKAGAYDFLLKPLNPKHLVALLERFTARTALEPEGAELDTGAESGRFGSMVGRSQAMREIFRVISRVARSDAPVMITGESGSGKEAAAQAIHGLSRRNGKPLVAVNCGAVSTTLIESELFGHERGAFTGADRRRLGYFEMAHGGTLFLDEVTEMSNELQVKFLRVLETRSFRRVGGNDELNVDVRIVASSNRDLLEAVRTEKLRGDLYYRLNVFPLRLPPLRERREDVPLLAQHFLERIEENEHAGISGFDAGALELLEAHDWPGNVRELRNVVHRGYVLSDGPTLTAQAIRSVLDGSPGPTVPTAPDAPPAPAPVDPGILQIRIGESFEEIERRTLQKTLESVGGNKRRAAEILGISLKTIYNKLKRFGL